MAQQSVEVRAPADQQEGTRSQVLRWLKAVGEPVAEHEPLLELETDKVTVEVPAPGSGVLAEVVKGEQEEVSGGDLLGRIRVSAASPAATAVREPAAGPSAEPVEFPAAAAPWPIERPFKDSAPARAAPAGSNRIAPHAADHTMRLSPAVRRLLAEHALDAAALPGTGEGGRITVEDVLRAAAGRDQGGTSQAAVLGGGADVPADMPSHKVPHSAVRKRIAGRMVESLLHTAPHVTTVFELDMAAVLAHRQRHRGDFERQGVALTLTAYFVRAAVEAVHAVPEANSRWTDEALEVFDSVAFGIGTATADGVVVPVLRRAETLDLFRTAQRVGDLVRRARTGALTPAQVRGATFTLSNHGVSGSLLATPIIIPQPQSAILGVGKLEKRAVVIEQDGAAKMRTQAETGSENDRIVIRPRCYATLTIDHRVMDGERANRFMQVFAQRLGSWPE